MQTCTVKKLTCGDELDAETDNGEDEDGSGDSEEEPPQLVETVQHGKQIPGTFLSKHTSIHSAAGCIYIVVLNIRLWLRPSIWSRRIKVQVFELHSIKAVSCRLHTTSNILHVSVA